MPDLGSIQGPVFDFILNNVILPPRLPQHECSSSRDGEVALLIAVESATKHFVTHLSHADARSWQPLIEMLSTWKELKLTESLCEERLKLALAGLCTIALHLRAQNAGLLIHVEDTSTVLFDAFEALPTNDEVMATQGRLIRAFPGSSVQVPLAVLHDAHFLQDFAASLRRLNDEEVAAMMPITTKARSKVVEIRDTAHPGLVTEYLMNLLAGLGRFQKGSTITKCTRDDVLWNNSKLPWTRSPFWLVLRVALQQGLVRAFPDDARHSHYKNFMLFFVTKLSDMALEARKPVETLSNINSKLARRAAKLGSRVFPFVIRGSLDAARRIRHVLEKVWNDLQLSETTPIVPFPLLGTNDQGSSLNLANSRIALERAMTRKHSNRVPTSFKPEHRLRMQQSNTDLPSLSRSGTDEDMLLLLSDFEVWVEHRLDHWIATRGAQADSCTQLCSISSSYLSHALSFYDSSPREMSLAVLTIFELWVALDKVCLMLHPLLGQFSPELDPQSLEVLLVPQLHQMQRLCKVENYLLLRAKRALLSNARIFEDPTSKSFGVQFYDSSTHHQKVKETIEDAARSTSLQKLSERQVMTSEYQALINRATSLKHFEEQLEEDGDMVHQPNKCERCGLETRAKSMKIVVHEWPLPSDVVQLKTAVVELDCPEAFVAWRDTTWMILQDLGRHTERIKHASNLYVKLRSYKQLARYIGRDTQEPRITLGSCTKPFLVSHYKSRTFPVSIDQICVNNGLQYRLLDSGRTGCAWVVDQKKSPSFKDFCVLKLPNGPYECLHWALRTTSHAPNEIISKQDDCPSTMELREFIEFGSLRAGERLQWFNILRELGSSNLTFSEEAVHTLVTQAAWEAGSPLEESVTREAHAPLNDESFCHKPLAILERLLSMIEANWKEQNTMLTIVDVFLRVLSLTPTTDVSVRCQRLLRRTRDVTLRWCHELTLKSAERVTKQEVEKMRTSVLRAALTCRETYCVDEPHIPELLSSDADVAALVESCIFARDNASGISLSPPQQELLRGAKTCHALEARLRSLIVSNGKGISLAISNRCGSVLMENGWSFPEAWGKRWGTVTTAQSASILSQTIHYDLLTGELLVDGRPLGRLPNEYTKEPVYCRLFGECVLQVSTSDMKGMEYMTTRKFSGHQVHFGIIEGNLVIKARLGDSTLEAIPHKVFFGDLPAYFVDTFVHWLDISTGVVEFRPLDNVWETCSSHWRLAYCAFGPTTMRLAHRELLDLSCAHSQWGLSIVARLEEESFVHITRADDGLIEVDLPRLSLRFFLNSTGYLQSRDFGDIVDPNQSFGTLLLEQISALTPSRKFYPSHKRSMQQVLWDGGLSSAAQHEDFCKEALAIKMSADRCSLLYDTSLIVRTSVDLDRGSDHLLERAAKRAGNFRSASYGGNATKSEDDRLHEARDDAGSCRGERVYSIASLIKEWPSRVNVAPDLRSIVRKWRKVSGYHVPFNQHHYTDLLALDIRSKWGSLVLPPTPSKLVNIADLLFTSKPPKLDDVPALRSPVPTVLEEHQRDISKLEATVSHFVDHHSSFQKQQGSVLQDSMRAFKHYSPEQLSAATHPSLDALEHHQQELNTHVEDTFNSLSQSLGPNKPHLVILQEVGLWPRITPQSLLEILAAKSGHRPNEQWKRALLHYGESMATLQRAERLVALKARQDTFGLAKELQNQGRQGWCAYNFPDWLLLELENNFTIRAIQARVALEMISPSSNDNTVLQLNMGEGKSSVIIPMVAAALANGKQLVRVVVLKPLLRQTEDLLAQRLGGLLNRRIYHTPFSRKTPLTTVVVQQLQTIFEECKSQRGLIYAVGAQRTIEGQPDRWVVSQAVLSRVSVHAGVLQSDHPDELELDQRDSAFPTLRFLKNSAARKLLNLIVKDVADGYISNLPLDYYSAAVRNATLRFIKDRKVSKEDQQLVINALGEGPQYKIVLLLRGLIAYDLLLFTLQKKRWLVEYGLDPSRCMMAVPYRAKGVPSTNSEFGHPDVAILLTCLSYYYSGLTHVHVRQSLHILFKDPNASDEYARWCEASTELPTWLRSLNGVNLDDENTFNACLVPCLRYNQAAINYYLSQVVFPREAKEFVKKLSASGWDLPAAAGCPVTTGFSGTNDNRFLLPLSIHHLLRNENSKYACTEDDDGKKISIESFLGLISRHNPPIRVLIDVGAQVLEMTNREVAQEWLRHAPNTKAAVFFSDNDEKMVIDQTGYLSLLSKSPYQDCLRDCVVYLDEVHTRGIDLKIPVGTQAAVTLGPRLNQDRLVQACMRMRKLGAGHTLAFFAPPDVNRSILDTTGTNITQQLSSTDVVRWCIEQTCLVTESVMPLWTMQGFALCERDRLCRSLLGGPGDLVGNLAEGKVRQFWTDIQEPEARTLRELYDLEDGPGKDDDDDVAEESDAGSMLAKLREARKATVATAMKDCTMNEEQEREVAHEIQRERQIQRPPPAPHYAHVLRPQVVDFVTSGITSSQGSKDSCPIQPAFKNFRKTSAAEYYWSNTACTNVLVTRDFLNTVQVTSGSPSDDFLRPVRWALTSTMTDDVLLISPYEANELIKQVRKSDKVTLHVFSPRTTKTMVAMDDLLFYNVTGRANGQTTAKIFKDSILRDLRLFAGSLFLGEQRQYQELGNFLGILTNPQHQDDSRVRVATDGFVDAASRQILSWPIACPFESSPLPFLETMLSLRMHNQSFMHTHMGSLVNGRAIQEDAFRGLNQQAAVDEDGEIETKGVSDLIWADLVGV
ncbi:hypothetical protein B0A49_06950 [Cryomyces minteri]|uniref:ubiquitinyl hydrolase 1 n=1 Tax=Cryomyces minteri TaxID=331657 RepID=A0A4U0XMY9_9PEZI|nr:hypothetical protein B0A49_06950 [Cryomyces minteri]